MSKSRDEKYAKTDKVKKQNNNNKKFESMIIGISL
tara:strand:- start:342 stop:446 length:105 start_codon:yes stop_codon:yes gene_type:complete